MTEGNPNKFSENAIREGRKEKKNALRRQLTSPGIRALKLVGLHREKRNIRETKCLTLGRSQEKERDG